MELSKGALVSMGEASSSRALRKYFRNRPFTIHKDVSVRQVIEVDRRELDPGEWSYYTKAAFDFVICNDDNTQSYELAIEYDGRQHENSTQARKDALKNRLCMQAGLPILRIGVEDVKIRSDITFLEYMLDLHFGEKALNQLQEKGLVDLDEDYFISTQFPGTDQILDRLMKKGILPGGWLFFVADRYGKSEAEKYYWYRVSEKRLTKTASRSSGQLYNKAQVQVDIIKGLGEKIPVITVGKIATLRECNPEYNVPGVYGWFLVLQLAKFMCFEEVERRVKKLFASEMYEM